MRLLILLFLVLIPYCSEAMQKGPRVPHSIPRVRKWVGFDNSRIISDYVHEPIKPGDFETLPPEVIYHIIAHMSNSGTLQEAVSSIKNFLVTEKWLAHILEDSKANKELIYYLSRRYKNSDSVETLLDTALMLGTKGTRAWLREQSRDPLWQNETVFLEKVVQKIPHEEYEEIAANVMTSGAMKQVGHTLLMQAIKDGHPERAYFLATNGADITCELDQGHTALQLARQQMHSLEVLMTATNEPDLKRSYEQSEKKWAALIPYLWGIQDYKGN